MEAQRIAMRTDRNTAIPAAALLSVAFGCLFFGGVLLYLSTLPNESFVRLAGLAGVARAQHSVFLPRLLPRLLPGGVLFICLGFSLFIFRRALVRLISDAAQSLGSYVSHTGKNTVRVLRTESRGHILALLIIVSVGILLRLRYLIEPPRIDEATTYRLYAGRSPFYLFLYSLPNNHVLHSALVWISCRVFGNTLWALRLPALLAGLAVIPLMYATARRMGGRNAGLWAAGLIAVSGPFVVYSVNARGYTLQAALFLLMLYTAAEILDGGGPACWIVFSVAATAGFFTAPTMLYSYLVGAGWLLWSGGRRVLWPLVISGAMTALAVLVLYMPVVIVSGLDLLIRVVRALPVEGFWAAAKRFPMFLLWLLHGGDPLPVKALIALGTFLSLIINARRRNGAHLLLILLLVLLIVPPMQRFVPPPRVLLPLFTVYYLAAALGWCGVLDKRFSAYDGHMPVLSVVAIGAMAFYLTRSGYIEYWNDFPESKSVSAYLSRQLRPCDRLINSESTVSALAWQFKHDGVQYRYYSPDEPTAGRVFATSLKFDILPPKGDPMLRLSGIDDLRPLTLEGGLSDAGFKQDSYSPRRLIYTTGRAEVFEFLARDPVAGSCPTP
jgi:hypothetical protein